MATERSSSARATPRRADARRNYEALVQAGHHVFTAHGVDAPFDDVARRAGVGRGTLYRHFPSREHLFAVLIDDQLCHLECLAHELITEPDSGAAVKQWLEAYDRASHSYRGLSRHLADGLKDETSPVAAACSPMRRSFGQLFVHAQQAGAVRPHLLAVDVLTLIAALPPNPDGTSSIKAHLDIAFRGLDT